MLPALLPEDRLLVEIVSFRLRRPRRGELVLFRHPEHSGMLTIKRVVGLPGEVMVRDTGEVWTGADLERPGLAPGSVSVLGPDRLFVRGDNRLESRDSRAFGPIGRHQLYGRAWYRYWPPERRGLL